MMSSMRSALAVAAGVALLAACGADDSGTALSEAATAGRSIYISNGCAACHGSDGGGGVGPSLVGLIGSTSEFTDGRSIVADRAYVIESIMEPAARKVAGYSIPMPMNNLSLSDVESIADFIAELELP